MTSTSLYVLVEAAKLPVEIPSEEAAQELFCCLYPTLNVKFVQSVADGFAISITEPNISFSKIITMCDETQRAEKTVQSLTRDIVALVNEIEQGRYLSLKAKHQQALLKARLQEPKIPIINAQTAEQQQTNEIPLKKTAMTTTTQTAPNLVNSNGLQENEEFATDNEMEMNLQMKALLTSLSQLTKQNRSMKEIIIAYEIKLAALLVANKNQPKQENDC